MSFQTVGLNKTLGINNISKDFIGIRGRKSVNFGVSLRGILSNHTSNYSEEPANISS